MAGSGSRPDNGAPPLKTLAIVGVGLIGASAARAAKARGLAERIVGADPDDKAREAALRLGVVDAVEAEVGPAVAEADLTIVAAPVGAIPSIFADIAGAAPSGAIVTDVGSVKSAVADAAKPFADRLRIVPGHPIAGTEKSGPEAGFASLFEGRYVLLTPLQQADAAYGDAVSAVSAFWAGCGAIVETMTPERHDLALAVTSHVPHLIAYNIVGTAADLETVTDSEVVKYSAGGFRDFTRIAASDPTMWRDVFLHNKEAVLEVLGRFTEDLSALQRAIRWGDGDALFNLFTRTREIRRNVIDAGQETDLPNFGRDAPDSPAAPGVAPPSAPSEKGGDLE
ncbi:MAG: prephenate/arogenate dehydrogenase family protein [Pseudomonadota bacterium]